MNRSVVDAVLSALPVAACMAPNIEFTDGSVRLCGVDQFKCRVKPSNDRARAEVGAWREDAGSGGVVVHVRVASPCHRSPASNATHELLLMTRGGCALIVQWLVC